MARGFIFAFGIFGLYWQIGYGEINKYDNYTLLRLYPSTEQQMVAFTNFTDPQKLVEVLKNSRGIDESMDVLVPPSRMKFMNEFVEDTGVLFEKQENYGRRFEILHRNARRTQRPFSPFKYQSYEAIDKYLDTVAKQHPQLVKLQDLGFSYEKRRMRLVKISSNPTGGNPIIFIDAGIHAREHVAPAMALYLIHQLTNRVSRRELNRVDWYILPLVNPDGYEFSRADYNNRMWRKTRSENEGCYGVDGNRNYGYKWAVSGVSRDPCNKETYAGPTAFSEPETRMVRDIMHNETRIKLYVSLHSYGQYLVYPWGYTEDYLPNKWKQLNHLAQVVSDSIVRVGGKPFQVLSAGQWYPAAGGSDDYAFGAAGIPYSYTMELTVGHEFLFPEHKLKVELPLYYEGFKTFASHIRKEFNYRPLRTNMSSETEAVSKESDSDEYSS